MYQYYRLNFTEREEISRQLASGSSIREVAKDLNRSPSTILREIRKNERTKERARHKIGTGS